MKLNLKAKIRFPFQTTHLWSNSVLMPHIATIIAYDNILVLMRW